MKIFLKIMGIFSFVLILIIGLVFYKYNALSKQTFNISSPINISTLVSEGDVALGKRIYTVRNGCIDCHGEHLAGAIIMDEPAMGNIHSANISNLKDWTDDEIAGAIRYGIHKSGRSLRFVPSFDFEGLSKEDIASVIKYIRSVTPVEKPSHENTFGPVAKFLSVFGQMPVMFPALIVDQTKGFAEKPVEAPTAEFGKYLVNSCTGCHGRELRGGKIPGGDPSWPVASNIRFGKASGMTEKEFSKIISTGIAKSTNKKVRLPMPISALQAMNELEKKSIWLYLSSLN